MSDKPEKSIDRKLFELPVHPRQRIILEHLLDNNGQANFRELKQTLVRHREHASEETDIEIEMKDFRFYLENVDLPILEDLGLVRSDYRENVVSLRDGAYRQLSVDRTSSNSPLPWELSYAILGLGLAALVLLHVSLSSPITGLILSWAVTIAVILLLGIAVFHHTAGGTF